MQYRKFGNTGISISALGFGAMRLPEYEKNGKWYMKEKVYGLTDYAKKEFAKLGKDSNDGQSPAACVECGLCETKCPQKIQIRKQLQLTLEALK